MSNELISYFGFGSLVNRKTRPEGEIAINVTLHGWRRVWNHRVTGEDIRSPCTSLSIEPADGSIEGVLVQIPREQLAALDEREYGYARLTLSSTQFELPAGLAVDDIQVYQSLPVNQIDADEYHPVMQSYVDCVMAGYHDRFGSDGLDRMLHSTRGWDWSRHNDRPQPTYPRSVELPVDQLHDFDQRLHHLSSGLLDSRYRYCSRS